LKAKRSKAVVDLKVHADAQTDNPTQIDDTTQTHDLNHNTPPSVLQRRELSTQSIYHIEDRP
jgi:hypothetical protein